MSCYHFGKRTFMKVWQIQRRTFIDGKHKSTEILAETDGSFDFAKRLFKKVTCLEPKEDYCRINSVMDEIGASGIKDEYLYLDACKRAMRIAFERNFTKVPFKDGSGYCAYGIKANLIEVTDSTDEG